MELYPIGTATSMKPRDVDGQQVPRVAERQALRKKNLKKNAIAPDISATNATKTGIVRAAS